MQLSAAEIEAVFSRVGVKASAKAEAEAKAQTSGIAQAVLPAEQSVHSPLETGASPAAENSCAPEEALQPQPARRLEPEAAPSDEPTIDSQPKPEPQPERSTRGTETSAATEPGKGQETRIQPLPEPQVSANSRAEAEFETQRDRIVQLEAEPQREPQAEPQPEREPGPEPALEAEPEPERQSPTASKDSESIVNTVRNILAEPDEPGPTDEQTPDIVTTEFGTSSPTHSTATDAKPPPAATHHSDSVTSRAKPPLRAPLVQQASQFLSNPVVRDVNQVFLG